jgi:hypothetical protein
VFNNIIKDEELAKKQFRGYTPLPIQIPIKDKPRFKSGQYVAENVQQKVIQWIEQIRKVENSGGLSVGYRQKDPSGFNQVRATVRCLLILELLFFFLEQL